MKHLYWVVASAVVLGGIYLAKSIRLGVPASTRISFDHYQEPHVLADQLIKNFQNELQQHALVFLGVSPKQPEDIELWTAFLQKLNQSPLQYKVVVVDSNLPYAENLSNTVKLDLGSEKQRFIEGVRQALAQKLRVAVIVPYQYSSQLVPNSPAMTLISTEKWPVLSLTVTKFPVTRQQERSFQPSCLGAGGGHNRPISVGTEELGCTVARVAQRTYREKLLDNQYAALVEQINEHDFLILFNRNAGSR
jgi:hypothetical protein